MYPQLIGGSLGTSLLAASMTLGIKRPQAIHIPVTTPSLQDSATQLQTFEVHIFVKGPAGLAHHFQLFVAWLKVVVFHICMLAILQIGHFLLVNWLSWLVLFSFVSSCFLLPCYALLCLAMACYALLCLAMLSSSLDQGAGSRSICTVPSLSFSVSKVWPASVSRTRK